MIIFSQQSAVLLAQSGSPTVKILIWVLGLIVLIVLGGLVILAVRRRMLSKNEPAGHESGLMDQMRALHAKGELSNEEYDQIRKRLVAKFTGDDPDSVVLIDRSAEKNTLSKPTEDPRAVRAKPGFDLTGDPLPFVARDPSNESDRPAERKPSHDAEGFPDTNWPGASE